MPDVAPDVARLQKTVTRLAAGLPQQGPDPELRNRIRANLAREWQAHGPRPDRGIPAWHSSRQRTRRTVWSTALAALVVIVIGTLAVPLVGVVLPGAAQSRSIVLVIVTVLGLLLGAVVWLFHHKLK
ncbi:MAG: hypothetical protein JXB85_01480 [Anaerolineales bacterium]|nr:hypothetical protein [Anaerolineales bacterium]